MSKVFKVIKNRNFVLFLALFSGLFVPYGAAQTRSFALPALAVVMTLSTLGISGKMFRSIGGLIRPAAVGIVMNYFILGGFILLLNALLIRDEGLWAGFVIVAATPPGVAIISLTDFMHGNRWLSLMGTVGGYLGALAVMPLVIFSFLGTAFFEPSKLLITIGQLIIAPLVASRILIYAGLDKRIEPIKGGLTNWSFFYHRIHHRRVEQGCFYRKAFEPRSRRCYRRIEHFFSRDGHRLRGETVPAGAFRSRKPGIARNHQEPRPCWRAGPVAFRPTNGRARDGLHSFHDRLFHLAQHKKRRFEAAGESRIVGRINEKNRA